MWNNVSSGEKNYYQEKASSILKLQDNNESVDETPIETSETNTDTSGGDKLPVQGAKRGRPKKGQLEEDKVLEIKDDPEDIPLAAVKTPGRPKNNTSVNGDKTVVQSKPEKSRENWLGLFKKACVYRMAECFSYSMLQFDELLGTGILVNFKILIS